MTELVLLQRKRFSLESLQKIYHFVGRQTCVYLALGILVGFLFFIVEFAFAFAIQAFLAFLGVMDTTMLKIPAWVPHETSTQVLSFIFALGVLRGLLQWAKSFLNGAVLEVTKHQQRTRILHWAFHAESVSSSKVNTFFNEWVNNTGAALLNVESLLIQSTTGLFIGVSLMTLAPIPTLISFGSLGILAVFLRLLDKKIKHTGKDLREEWEKTNATLTLSIKNLLLMQIYGTQSLEESKATGSLGRYHRHIMSYYKISGLKFAIPQILGVGLIVVVCLSTYELGLATGTILVSYFYLSFRFLQIFAEIVKITSLSSILLPQVSQLASWWSQHSDDTPKARERLRSRKEVSVSSEKFSSPLGWEIKDLTFGFSGVPDPVIRDLSVTIHPGQALVIMGPSGAGKTTLLNLMLGLNRPSSGSIRLLADGGSAPVADVKSRLLQSIGYVGPESFLIEGTVYENIVYGLNRTPTDAEIDEAIQNAECQFLYDMPKKLDHFLTEQGKGLSAGQKQRISLARAFLRKPQVLILDEATSNLDNTTEEKLLQTFEKAKGKVTIIAVTHRPTFLKIADQKMTMAPVVGS